MPSSPTGMLLYWGVLHAWKSPFPLHFQKVELLCVFFTTSQLYFVHKVHFLGVQPSSVNIKTKIIPMKPNTRAWQISEVRLSYSDTVLTTSLSRDWFKQKTKTLSRDGIFRPCHHTWPTTWPVYYWHLIKRCSLSPEAYLLVLFNGILECTRTLRTNWACKVFCVFMLLSPKEHINTLSTPVLSIALPVSINTYGTVFDKYFSKNQ